MPYRYSPLPTETVRALQAGAPDAHGRQAERQISDGTVGCRHCLTNIAKGSPALLVAHTPFTTVQPYAETGPLYICAEPCAPGGNSQEAPELLDSPSYILRGYGPDERILYGTGAVTPIGAFDQRIRELFARPEVAFIDIRSAANNCFQCRIERA